MGKISGFTSQRTLAASDRFEVAVIGDTGEFYATPDDIKTYISARKQLSAPLTLYVNPSTGSNSNNGLTSGTAFATIQKAIDTAAVLDLGLYDVTIQLADSTSYANGNILRPYVTGGGRIIIQGNSSSPSNVSTSGSGWAFYHDAPSAPYTIKDLKITSTSGGGLQCSGGNLAFSNLVFHNCTSPHMIAYANGRIYTDGNWQITGGTDVHCWAQTGGFIQTAGRTVTLSGSPSFSAQVFYADRAHIDAYLMSFSGSCSGIRYTATGNGTIFTAGGSSTYFPGNISGYTLNGGQYY